MLSKMELGRCSNVIHKSSPELIRNYEKAYGLKDTLIVTLQRIEEHFEKKRKISRIQFLSLFVLICLPLCGISFVDIPLSLTLGVAAFLFALYFILLRKGNNLYIQKSTDDSVIQQFWTDMCVLRDAKLSEITAKSLLDLLETSESAVQNSIAAVEKGRYDSATSTEDLIQLCQVDVSVAQHTLGCVTEAVRIFGVYRTIRR